MSETSEHRKARNDIRRLMRERRRRLDSSEMRRASEQLCKRLFALPRRHRIRNLAAYLTVSNEIPLDPVIEMAWSLHIPVYLPCLRGQHLEFRRYTPESTLRRNRFGIPEPEIVQGARINAKFLDTVLTPLLAFDEAGGRLGTGGGFYDRSFEFLRERNYWKRPTLIGVAYEFQCVPALPLAAWDVPMHAVVTDATTRTFRTDMENPACTTG